MGPSWRPIKGRGRRAPAPCESFGYGGATAGGALGSQAAYRGAPRQPEISRRLREDRLRTWPARPWQPALAAVPVLLAQSRNACRVWHPGVPSARFLARPHCVAQLNQDGVRASDDRRGPRKGYVRIRCWFDREATSMTWLFPTANADRAQQNHAAP